VDQQTRAVVERLGWRDAPPRGSLDILERSAACSVLHDAWVAGEIPGFPNDDHQLILAQRHVLRSAEVEAAARERRRPHRP
jgi:hypothetical protein